MFVFFFKQKTAYEMRISDWSSDVCSSDLVIAMMAVNRPEKAADGEMAADKYKRLGERLFRIAPDGLERGKMFELVSCQQVGSRFHVVEWASPVWRCHDSFQIGRAHV